MRLHTIGDSHCYHGWYTVPNLLWHHLGPKLMYTFGKENFNLLSFKDNGTIKDGDIVIYCFGEIDCRCHIFKHRETYYLDQVEEIVYNYIETIKENSKLLNVKSWVYNVVPPVRRESLKEDPEFPFVGTDKERLKCVLQMNKRLKEKCKDNGFTFVDIYKEHSDDDRFLKFRDGGVHIGTDKFLRRFVDNQLELLK